MTENELKNLFLRQRQSLPLTIKRKMTARRIRQAYEMFDGNIFVSLSGGADSTVVLNEVRAIYPHIPGVFVDTGMEYPEIREFVRTLDNIVWVKPKMTFKQVIEKYGYPVVSKETAQKLHEIRQTKSDFMLRLRTTGIEGRKRQQVPAKWKFLIDAPFKISHKCCEILKHGPLDRYAKETGCIAITGEMASESSARVRKITAHGCFFMGKQPRVKPMSFWTEADSHTVLQTLPHCKLYDPPYNFPRTGCMLCAFGAHLNSPNKFQTLEISHPRLHKLGIPAFGLDKVLDYCGIPYNTEQKELF